MKKILSATFILASAVQVFAADGVLISKSSGGGFMHPEFGGSESCQLYADKVVVTHTFGFSGPTATKISETKSIALTGDLQKVIDIAKTEQVSEKPNNLCDGPSTSIVGHAANGEDVLIFVTGGCGSPEKSRNGVASDKLTSLIDLYCPQTFRFGQEE